MPVGIIEAAAPDPVSDIAGRQTCCRSDRQLEYEQDVARFLAREPADLRPAKGIGGGHSPQPKGVLLPRGASADALATHQRDVALGRNVHRKALLPPPETMRSEGLRELSVSGAARLILVERLNWAILYGRARRYSQPERVA